MLAAGDGMYTDMEQWAEICRRVLTVQISKRAACKEYDIHWDTLGKMFAHSQLPGYRRSKPGTSKLAQFLTVIQQILKDDKSSHRKQRHTAKKIFECLQAEHGDSGGQTLVAMAVRDLKQEPREVFLPLSYPPGEARIDFGFADVILNGQLTGTTLAQNSRQRTQLDTRVL